MGYLNLKECVNDLEKTGQLVRINQEVDARLEAAEIHRRVNAAGGPALLFARVKDCTFPMVSNLFGTLSRTRFLFRDTLETVERLVELKIDPAGALKNLWQYRGVPLAVWTTKPVRCSAGPILANETRIALLPMQVSWPRDGGAFITLPEVYTEDASRPGFAHSNLGMYRIQLSGGRYEPNRQVGLHYQIHRSIGVHHAAAIRAGKPFHVNIFVGGAPAMMLAAVMPLPEGMSELSFAGVLGGRRVPMIMGKSPLPIYAQADFCITGTVVPEKLLPEGPFGDHLGYYSLAHDFPVLNVEKVFHRDGAIWPFTVVGRPPQEDTAFGQIIHELTGPVIPTVAAGVKEVHAVDAAGVHPLLLAIGSERYVPYARSRHPQELLTCANALLGQGQLSLAKYLLILAGEDDPQLKTRDVPAFFAHLLKRVDWQRDLHFQTCTTIDTLDYSGTALNEGSKLVIAAAGDVRRELPTQLPAALSLPEGFRDPRVCLPGVAVLAGPAYQPAGDGSEPALARFVEQVHLNHPLNAFPLVVLADDSEFTARNLDNFLWVTFTRSNPAADVSGIGAFIRQKHWGCRGALVIDARIKPHHAPVLEPDPEVSRRVDQLAARGGPLYGIV